MFTRVNQQTSYDGLSVPGSVRISGQDFNRQVMALTPAAFWKMNETSGNLVDSSGNGKTATKVGTPTYGVAQATISDGLTCVSLNGSTDYFDAGDNFGFSGTAAFSFGLWVNINTAFLGTGTFKRVASKEVSDGGGRQGWDLLCHSTTGWIYFERWLNGATGGGSVSTSATLPVGRWVFLVVTYDGTTMKMYDSISGSIVTSSASNTLSLLANAGPFRIGRHSTSNGATSTDNLDAKVMRPFFVSGRAISAAEVSALYAARRYMTPRISGDSHKRVL